MPTTACCRGAATRTRAWAPPRWPRRPHAARRPRPMTYRTTSLPTTSGCARSCRSRRRRALASGISSCCAVASQRLLFPPSLPLDPDPAQHLPPSPTATHPCAGAQVSRASEYFRRWVARWPTVAHLASASQEEVNEAWAGLGYYRRARFLLEGARHVVDQLGGALPADPEELRKIPGERAQQVGGTPGRAAAAGLASCQEPSCAAQGPLPCAPLGPSCPPTDSQTHTHTR